MAKSPEQRTAELFSQNYDLLESELHQRRVAIPETDISLILMEFKPYSFTENQKQWLYSPMRQMEAGDLWARYYPLRKMCLSLIVAVDVDRPGACLQVTKANRVIPERSTSVPLPKQGDIAGFLRLGQNEVGRLRFLDETETLYLIPTGRIVDKLVVEGNKGSAQEADRKLEQFFESI